MQFISFVIPCYRSEQTISAVISEIHDKMKEKKEYDYEIITVNDCSPDNVMSVLKSLAENDKKLKVIGLSINVGKHGAVMAGLSAAKGDIIVNLDDDGQCPLDKLWELIQPLYEDNDISIAHYPHKKQSAFKNIGSRINAVMARVMINKPSDLYLSNFSAIKRFVADEILRYKNPYPYISGLFLRSTSKIVNVPMEERERAAGEGNYTLKKSLALWMNGFTAFSVKPLRISTVCGCLSAMIGFLYGIFIIVHKLMHPAVTVGYSSLMAVLLFIGGMIMLMLGLIGEYIGRIYISINNSPQYVIREKVNFDNDWAE